MKRIKLPIDTTLFCQFDLKNIDPQSIQVIDGKKVISFAKIDISAGHKEIEIARDNGAQIVYGLLSVEHKINSILAEYLFGPTLGSPKPKKDFFVNEVLQSNRFDYSFKKELLSTIVSECNLLVGQDKDVLQSHLKKIMTWRNAFAHGHLSADNAQVCYLKYYLGGNKSIVLNDDFWTEVEVCFQQINELFKKLKFPNEESTSK